MMKRQVYCCLVAGMILAFAAAGCAVNLYSGRPSDKTKIGQLSGEVERLQQLREKERQELQEAMELLEKRLKKEIDDKEVRLEMAERGLVITFVAEVLFDSGKAKIREGAYPILDKVAKVIRDKVYDREIGVEGHTDNEPIKFSGWKSNWELSTARATSVLHYLVEPGKLDPKKLSAIGYGEYRPIDSNETVEGRQKNRRVEVVIVPKVEKEREAKNKGFVKEPKPVKYEEKIK
ncbi:MAG: OmpA family protein [Candidatus Omnitrophica bacterium]|nr:OmpA family protein [Candidatus Omnitrophota bacterium]